MRKLLVPVLLIIVGCGETIKSPEYYYANIDEAQKVYEKCVAMKKKVVSENCINARKAILYGIKNRFNYEGLLEYKESNLP